MKTALVIEGGSLRCLFSAGVTDIMLENGIKFDAVYGVSSGALVGVSFVAEQPGRTKRVNVNFVNDSNYMGAKPFIKHKSVFNFDYLFGTISDIYVPLDRNTFEKSNTEFICVATDLNTGKAIYFDKHNCSDIYTGMRASSSMPLLSPIVELDGKKCLDGGIKIAVPYQKAIDDGYDRIIVVTTREHGFRKPFTSSALAELYLNRYYMYPEFVKTLIDTPRMYGEQMNELDKLSASGRIYIVRPRDPVKVSRTESDTSKLLELYDIGRKIGMEQLESMRRYIDK